jgi:hypothetical protein
VGENDELPGKCVARALRVCVDALCVFLLVILPVVLSLCFLSRFFFSSSGHKNTQREREREREGERVSELLQQSVGVYSFFIPSLWKCRNLDQELAAVAEGRRRRNRNRKKRNGFCVIFNSEVLPRLGDKGFWFCQGLFYPFFFALFCEVFFFGSVFSLFFGWLV